MYALVCGNYTATPKIHAVHIYQLRRRRLDGRARPGSPLRRVPVVAAEDARLVVLDDARADADAELVAVDDRRRFVPPEPRLRAERDAPLLPPPLLRLPLPLLRLRADRLDARLLGGGRLLSSPNDSGPKDM